MILEPPIEPMLAKLAHELPEGDGWLFEPKWDGFRAIVFRDGDRVYLQSRDLKPLDRYFPELAAPLRASLPERCVIDGEIVIATELPAGDGWLFEPKWDGFRAIVFRDGDRVYLQSRDLKPLDRYFPELAAPLQECRPRRPWSTARS